MRNDTDKLSTKNRTKNNNNIKNKTDHKSQKTTQQNKNKNENKEIKQKINKYHIDTITKQNYQISHIKNNITQLNQLSLKYVLKCIDGLYKNRFLFITTHPDGEIFGSGIAKLYGLTLQIQGVGLSQKHAQLKYDGFKSFNVIDFNSNNGTWLNLSKQGVQIKNQQQFAIGQNMIKFIYAQTIDEIQQICIVYHVSYLSDILQYNGIKTLSQLYVAQYNNFQGYPFDSKEIIKLKRICQQTKIWYKQNYHYHRLNIHYMNQPLKDLDIQIGWQMYPITQDPNMIFTGKNPLARVIRQKLIPEGKVFSRIHEGQSVPLNLHNQIKIGDLSFEMTRFNSGYGEDIGFRQNMQDTYIVQEDIGGSQWKLISLFAVIDGYGGNQCMKFISKNLVQKMRGWTKLLDDANDLTQMIKVLVSRSFFELDYQFYKQYPQLSMTCGATILCVIIIESRAFVFNVGDCKSCVFRDDIVFNLNIDHLPNRGDQRIRIQNAGGFIQYDRLMGKCTLSRAMGQFQYKCIEDYQNQMKGKLKSYLSCIPQLLTFDIKPQKDQFIFLSTDGIFESMNYVQIVDFIRQRYHKLEMQENPDKIISAIMQNCKVMTPNCDNMSAILLIIKKGALW